MITIAITATLFAEPSKLAMALIGVKLATALIYLAAAIINKG